MAWARRRVSSDASDSESDSGSLAFPPPLPFRVDRGGRGSERSLAEIDPEELVDRADLASAIRKAGEPELAKAELGKILILNPDHIGARLTRATQEIEARRLDEAFSDIERVIYDPRLVEYTREELALHADSGHPTIFPSSRPWKSRLAISVKRAGRGRQQDRTSCPGPRNRTGSARRSLPLQSRKGLRPRTRYYRQTRRTRSLTNFTALPARTRCSGNTMKQILRLRPFARPSMKCWQRGPTRSPNMSAGLPRCHRKKENKGDRWRQRICRPCQGRFQALTWPRSAIIRLIPQEEQPECGFVAHPPPTVSGS